MLHRGAALTRIRAATFPDFIQWLFPDQLKQPLRSGLRTLRVVPELKPGCGHCDRLVVRLFLAQLLQPLGQQVLADLLFRKRINQIEQLALDRTLIFCLFTVVRNRLPARVGGVVLRQTISVLDFNTNLQIKRTFTRPRLLSNHNDLFSKISGIPIRQSLSKCLGVKIVRVDTRSSAVIFPRAQHFLVVDHRLHDRNSVGGTIDLQQFLNSPIS